MTHVQFNYGEGAGSLVVDGIDLTPHVLRRGFGIEIPENGFGPALVHLTIAADSLEGDLPEAIVEALRDAEVTE